MGERGFSKSSRTSKRNRSRSNSPYKDRKGMSKTKHHKLNTSPQRSMSKVRKKKNASEINNRVSHSPEYRPVSPDQSPEYRPSSPEYRPTSPTLPESPEYRPTSS